MVQNSPLAFYQKRPDSTPNLRLTIFGNHPLDQTSRNIFWTYFFHSTFCIHHWKLVDRRLLRMSEDSSDEKP